MHKQRKKIAVAANVLLLPAAFGALLIGAFLNAGVLEGPKFAAPVVYAVSAAVFVLWIVSLFLVREQKREPFAHRFFVPELLRGKSRAHVVAYIGVTAALCIVSNLFEFRFADIQFSLTVFTSVLAGILIGPIYGFIAVFLGDAVGYIANSWGYLYLPWVGLSCAAMALIAGLVMKLPFRFKGSGYVKLALICVLTLAVCSVGINTTGFYFYYASVGFSSKALTLIEKYFGGANGYLAYAVVRLFFMGQIWNSLFNYALLFLVLPLLGAVKPLKLRIL